MKVYVPATIGTTRHYEQIETTRAKWYRGVSGMVTVICDGICYNGAALFATADDALTYGCSHGLNSAAHALNPRDLDWKVYDNRITGEHRSTLK